MDEEVPPIEEPESPFERLDKARSLRQCELLCGVPEHMVRAPDGTEKLEVETLNHPYALIVTQDCDLDQDFSKRSSGSDSRSYRQLRQVLLCEVWTADELRGASKPPAKNEEPPVLDLAVNSSTWVQIKQNNDYRFHFLESSPPQVDLEEVGTPELAVHFRRVFSISASALYGMVNAGHVTRRCRLKSPYAEHLSQRFTNYWARVALPEPHRSL